MKTEDFLDYEVIPKLDAAKRQLDTAIDLWFADGDSVSMHTLIGAAHQIVHDTNLKRGGKELLFNSPRIPDDQREEFGKALRRNFMYFKHADRDHDSQTLFLPYFTTLFIMVTIATLAQMDEKLTDNQLAFSNYIAVFAPDLLDEEMRRHVENTFKVEVLALMRTLDKRKFYELARQGIAQARAQGRL